MPEKTTQLLVLKSQLEQAGWESLEIDSDPPEWWSAEFWRLKSTWSDDGPELWITLLVDPQIETGKSKRDEVWAMGAGPIRPSTRDEAARVALLALGRGWRKQVPTFLSSIQQYRLQRKA